MRAHRLAILVGLAASAIAALACNSLLGIEDVTLGGDDGGGGTDVGPGPDAPRSDAQSDAPIPDGGPGADAFDGAPSPDLTVALESLTTCAKKIDGTVFCWGEDGAGQSGNGVPWEAGGRPNITLPSQVVKVTDAVLLAAGYNHACIVRKSSQVSCWGYNYFGQLGNGTTQVNASSPVDVKGLGDAVTIAGGTVFTCAIKRGGAVVCWGANYSGQLGNGTKTDSNVPVPVTGLTDAIAVTAGDSHACALRNGGTVTCWGGNYSGQLGNGSTTDSQVPVPIPTLSNVTAIAAGGTTTCAMLAGGTMSCWGSNDHGQLGNGSASITPNPTPVTVATLNDVVAIGAGFQHMCAVRSSGGIACWGAGGDGQLGNGISLADADTPTPLPAAVQTITNATGVSGGAFHTCASTKDHRLFCWGSNSSGQLGNGTLNRSYAPVAVSGF